MPNPSDEFQRRTGHRFNLIIKSLPSSESEAITLDALQARLKKIGYLETSEQLAVDVAALIRRKEVSQATSGQNPVFWVLAKGLFEIRKRKALIMLHNSDISEDDLKELEAIAHRKRGHVE
jgi:hypothetical protein